MGSSTPLGGAAASDEELVSRAEGLLRSAARGDRAAVELR